MSYEFLVETYETERLKTLSVWSLFAAGDLAVRPHPSDRRGRSVREHMVHQCVSENVWFERMLGIDVGAPPQHSATPPPLLAPHRFRAPSTQHSRGPRPPRRVRRAGPGGDRPDRGRHAQRRQDDGVRFEEHTNCHRRGGEPCPPAGYTSSDTDHGRADQPPRGKNCDQRFTVARTCAPKPRVETPSPPQAPHAPADSEHEPTDSHHDPHVHPGPGDHAHHQRAVLQRYVELATCIHRSVDHLGQPAPARLRREWLPRTRQLARQLGHTTNVTASTQTTHLPSNRK